jgi:hypothetical protein
LRRRKLPDSWQAPRRHAGTLLYMLHYPPSVTGRDRFRQSSLPPLPAHAPRKAGPHGKIAVKSSSDAFRCDRFCRLAEIIAPPHCSFSLRFSTFGIASCEPGQQHRKTPRSVPMPARDNRTLHRWRYRGGHEIGHGTGESADNAGESRTYGFGMPLALSACAAVQSGGMVRRV